MPIYTTQHTYAAATGRNKDSTSRRFRALPYTETPGKTPRLYHLAAVLPTLHRSEHHCIPALFESATETGAHYVGPDTLSICRTFERWADEGMKDRLHAVQRRLTTALAAGLQSSTIFDHLHALHSKLCLVGGVLQWMVLNDPTRLPDLSTASGWPIQWSITNAVYESETV